MREAPVVARIREATAADARAIAEVHVRSWRAAYRGQMPDDYLAGQSVERREEMWRSGLSAPEPGQGCLVAEDQGGRIIGFCSYGPTHDEDAPAGTGEVHAIYLEPDVLGKGIGRELFALANERLRDAGFEHAILWVLETNERARRFYEKAGWWFDGTTSTEQVECLNLPTVRYRIEPA